MNRLPGRSRSGVTGFGFLGADNIPKAGGLRGLDGHGILGDDDLMIGYRRNGTRVMNKYQRDRKRDTHRDLYRKPCIKTKNSDIRVENQET